MNTPVGVNMTVNTSSKPPSCYQSGREAPLGQRPGLMGLLMQNPPSCALATEVPSLYNLSVAGVEGLALHQYLLQKVRPGDEARALTEARLL